ncbi:blue-copper-binding protein [Prunus dulcis]|uniref:Blue-copper-binding protein n=1 Tax=Prunus dulcis TaxID=3755 RepID=A0A5H2XLT1_PRUDU|nr:blue-copper-binding protein [Prunus dulcis]
MLGAAADNYTVGDDLGWTIPPAGSIAYKTWANKKSFQIGDTIVFNWTGSHTVAEVSEANYGNCTKSNPLALYDSSPVPITLTSNLTDTSYARWTITAVVWDRRFNAGTVGSFFSSFFGNLLDV